MLNRFTRRFCLLTTLIASAPLWAKGDIVVIEVKGGALKSPVKITDPKIEKFSLWAGPGVNGTTLQNAKGFIIDWQAGVAASPPAGFQHYEVSFYVGCRSIQDDSNCLSTKPSLAYVVFYDYDSSSKRGFVYLPGKGDRSYKLNSSSIWRGPEVDGQWFVAAASWEDFVRPLIANAL